MDICPEELLIDGREPNNWRKHAAALATEAAESTWSKRNVDGSWSPCEEPEPLIKRQLYSAPARKEPELEAIFLESGEMILARDVPLTEDKSKLAKAKKWFALSDEAREDFLTRAKRNMSPESYEDYAEYAGYYLFARGQHHPISILEYRTLAKKNARSASASKSRRNRVNEG